MLFQARANEVLNNLVGRANPVTFGTTMSIGLSTTEPAADATNITEPSGNGYARSVIGVIGESSSFKFSAAAVGAITNDKIIFFNKATGAWGVCTHAVIYNQAGTPIASGVLTSSISPVSGDVPIIEVGQLDITLA